MAIPSELSRPVKLDMLGDAPRAMEIEATEAERAALARRFGLPAVDALGATVTLAREGEVVRCAGRLRARVVQACVASGDPVEAMVDEDFALRFVPEASTAGDEEEVELDADALDEIGYAGGAIDVGEAVAQTLDLALDPFPRAPSADVALKQAGVLAEEDVGPFAALKGLLKPE